MINNRSVKPNPIESLNNKAKPMTRPLLNSKWKTKDKPAKPLKNNPGEKFLPVPKQRQQKNSEKLHSQQIPNNLYSPLQGKNLVR